MIPFLYAVYLLWHIAGIPASPDAILTGGLVVICGVPRMKNVRDIGMACLCVMLCVSKCVTHIHELDRDRTIVQLTLCAMVACYSGYRKRGTLLTVCWPPIAALLFCNNPFIMWNVFPVATMSGIFILDRVMLRVEEYTHFCVRTTPCKPEFICETCYRPVEWVEPYYIDSRQRTRGHAACQPSMPVTRIKKTCTICKKKTKNHYTWCTLCGSVMHNKCFEAMKTRCKLLQCGTCKSILFCDFR